jgi:hypothetical protein
MPSSSTSASMWVSTNGRDGNSDRSVRTLPRSQIHVGVVLVAASTFQHQSIGAGRDGAQAVAQAGVTGVADAASLVFDEETIAVQRRLVLDPEGAEAYRAGLLLLLVNLDEMEVEAAALAVMDRVGADACQFVQPRLHAGRPHHPQVGAAAGAHEIFQQQEGCGRHGNG